MIYEQGDVISINFDPSKRHEPAGRHYAVVISPWQVNSMSSLTLVAPITSNDNHYPLHVPIQPGNPIHGFIQCEALRAMDLDARSNEGRLEYTGSLDDTTMQAVMGCVAVVTGLDSSR
jgi:mRNA interferase MazF